MWELLFSSNMLRPTISDGLWIWVQMRMEAAYWDTCNDPPQADPLTLRLKSSTYASAKSLGILCFSQTHDEAGTSFSVTRRSHNEGDAVGQFAGKNYL